MTANDQETHLCKDCYECNKGFTYDEEERKQCNECGGTVLFLQEAADHIAELSEYKFMYEGLCK